MPRKISKVVSNCKDCPYCQFDVAIGENFCTHNRERGTGSYIPLDDHINVRQEIFVGCPLPWVDEVVAPTTSYACGALQVQELNDCPEEWMEQIIAEEEAHDQRMRRETERDVEKLFEGFDENDEPWDYQK